MTATTAAATLRHGQRVRCYGDVVTYVAPNPVRPELAIVVRDGAVVANVLADAIQDVAAYTTVEVLLYDDEIDGIANASQPNPLRPRERGWAKVIEACRAAQANRA